MSILAAGFLVGAMEARAADRGASQPAYDMNLWRQLNTPGVQSMWDFGYGPSLDTLPHMMPGQRSNLAQPSVPPRARRGAGPTATPRSRGAAPTPLPLIDPGTYHRAVFTRGEGPALAVDAACSLTTMAFNWKVASFFEELRPKYPKGTKFWTEIEVAYGNKSGTPNALACPSNSDFFPSPMGSSLCVGPYELRNLGAVYRPKPPPDRRSECVQIRQTQLTGTGDITDGLNLSVEPSALRVALCTPFKVGAKVGVQMAEGRTEGSFAAPVRWSPSQGLRSVAQFGRAGGDAGRQFDVRTFEAIEFGKHTIQVFLEDPSLTKPKMATVTVEVAAPPPAVMEILPFEEIALSVGDRLGFSVWGTRTVSCGKDQANRQEKLTEGVVWSANRGRFEGDVYHASEAGPVVIFAQWRDPVTGRTFEASKRLEVEEKDDLRLSLTADKTRMAACDRVTLVPRVTTASGRPVIGDPKALGPSRDSQEQLQGVKNVELEWASEGPGGYGTAWYPPSGYGDTGKLVAEFTLPGRYLVRAKVKGAAAEKATAQVEIEVVDMTPTSLEVIPSKRKIEAGERIAVEARPRFPVDPASLPGFAPQEIRLTASVGTIRDGQFWSNEPGEHAITAAYRMPDNCDGIEVTASTPVVVENPTGGAHVDAWVTRSPSEARLLGNAYSSFGSR